MREELNDLIFSLLMKREHFKRERNYRVSDELRDFAVSCGIKVEDISMTQSVLDENPDMAKNGWKAGDFWASNWTELDPAFFIHDLRDIHSDLPEQRMEEKIRCGMELLGSIEELQYA